MVFCTNIDLCLVCGVATVNETLFFLVGDLCLELVQKNCECVIRPEVTLSG